MHISHFVESRARTKSFFLDTTTNATTSDEDFFRRLTPAVADKRSDLRKSEEKCILQMQTRTRYRETTHSCLFQRQSALLRYKAGQALESLSHGRAPPIFFPPLRARRRPRWRAGDGVPLAAARSSPFSRCSSPHQPSPILPVLLAIPGLFYGEGIFSFEACEASFCPSKESQRVRRWIRHGGLKAFYSKLFAAEIFSLSQRLRALRLLQSARSEAPRIRILSLRRASTSARWRRTKTSFICISRKAPRTCSTSNLVVCKLCVGINI